MIMMTHYRFQIIKETRRKSGICPVCGKRVSRSNTEWQSCNPYNKNEYGEAKSISQIRDELKARLDKWEADPVKHARCE